MLESYPMVLKQKNGYTLIEVVIVIVLILILSASIFVYVNFSRDFNLDSAASKVASDLRYAQSLSMSTARWYGVSFEGNSYAIYTTTGTLDTLINDPASFGKDMVVNVYDQFGLSVNVYIDGGNKIEFSPLGQPYIDRNSFILTNEGVVTLSTGALSKTVRITPNTGKVYIQ